MIGRDNLLKLYLDDTEMQELQDFSERKGVSAAQCVRSIIFDFIKKANKVKVIK